MTHGDQILRGNQITCGNIVFTAAFPRVENFFSPFNAARCTASKLDNVTHHGEAEIARGQDDTNKKSGSSSNPGLQTDPKSF